MELLEVQYEQKVLSLDVYKRQERNVWYQGRSRQQVETEYEPCSNNEWREVSRGHSNKTVANVMGRTEL